MIVARIVRRLALVEPEEMRPVWLSAAYFFLLLCSYYLLKPVRDAMGIDRGVDKLPWLMTGTLVAMLAINPAFAALVSRLPRRRFIPLTYRFFAANLAVFFVLFQLLPGHGGAGLGYVFFVWVSVFNLFVVSVFWGTLADVFSPQTAKRLFGAIAVGGTLGGICGAALTEHLVHGITIAHVHLRVPPAAMLIVAMIPLEGGVQCVRRLLAVSAPDTWRGRRAAEQSGPGGWAKGGALEGLALLARSRDLQLIGGYVLFWAVTSSLLYIEQGRIVSRTFPDLASRTVASARIEFWTNAITLVVQVFLSGRIISAVGVGGGLAVVPLVTMAGFEALRQWPVFSALAMVVVARRALHYAIDRPTREVLFTALGRDARFKSKPFIDTFVYRSGDMIGGWTPTWLAAYAISTAAVGVPLALAWAAVAAALGWRHRARAADPASAVAPGFPVLTTSAARTSSPPDYG